MNISKINAPSLKEIFVKTIIKKILSGEMKPGERFPSERELADLTGVSRSIVNQGMIELEMNGFVSMIPRKGNFVSDYNESPTPHTIASIMSYDSRKLEPKLFMDLMATRMLIETECVKLACKNMDRELLDEMKQQLVILSENPDLVIDCLFQFHYLIIKGSGNGVYTMIYKGFEPALRKMFDEHYRVEEDIEDTLSMHEKLLRSIEAHDEKTALKDIKGILNRGIEILKQEFN